LLPAFLSDFTPHPLHTLEVLYSSMSKTQIPCTQRSLSLTHLRRGLGRLPRRFVFHKAFPNGTTSLSFGVLPIMALQAVSRVFFVHVHLPLEQFLAAKV